MGFERGFIRDADVPCCRIVVVEQMATPEPEGKEEVEENKGEPPVVQAAATPAPEGATGVDEAK